MICNDYVNLKREMLRIGIKGVKASESTHIIGKFSNIRQSSYFTTEINKNGQDTSKMDPIENILRNFSNRYVHIVRDNKLLVNFEDNLSASEVVSQDMGLRNFLKRTYATSIIGITGSLTLAEILSMGPLFSHNALVYAGMGFITALGGCFAITKGKYIITKNDNGELKAENSPTRLLGYGALTIGMGISIVPLISFLPPTVLPSAICLSLLTMGGASLFAYKSKSADMLKWGPPLMGGLFGLIGLQLVGLGSYLVVGPNVMYDAIHNINTYGGIALFAGLTAYETHAAIDMYKKNEPDHLLCASNLYLDFMNLLVRFIDIISKYKKD